MRRRIMYGILDDECITYINDEVHGLHSVSIKMLNKELVSVQDTIRWALDYQSHHFTLGERGETLLVLHHPYQREFSVCIDYTTDSIILTPLY